MRRDEFRDRVRALLGGAVGLALLVAVAPTADAQGKRGGGDDAPAQGQGQQRPGAPSPGAGQPTAPPRPTANVEPPPVDTSPLARYIPAESVRLYFEFPGVNAFPEAWAQTAARGMLNDTTLGEMLRDLVTQLVDRNRTGPAKLGGADLVAVLDHVMQHGVVFSAPGWPSAPNAVVVFRNGGHKSARATFGRLIGQMTPADAKPKVTTRAGGRQVVVVDRMPGAPVAPTSSPGAPGAAPAPPPTGGSWAWWIERNDLVMVLGDSNAADPIMAVLDGGVPNAVEAAPIVELQRPEGSFTPAAFGFIRFGGADASPDEARFVEQHGLDGLDLRWGFEGEALMTVARADAAAPRKGAMALFDQPTFAADSLPPIPADVKSFTVLSVDPTKLLDQLGPVLDQAQPGAGSKMTEALKEALKSSKNPLDLRDNVLAHLGPRIVFYQTGTAAPASTAPAAGAAGPMAGLMGMLGGMKLPEFTLMAELKDKKAFERSLDAIIITANERLKTAFPSPPPAAGAAAPRPGARPPAPEVVKFQLTTISPKTYTLVLPAGLAALTGVTPTITMGQSHVIVSTTPPAARQARLAEASSSADRWTPQGTTSAALGRLPANLMMLAYADSTDTMPQALAALPTALDAALKGGPGGLEQLNKLASGDLSALAAAGGAPGGAPGTSGRGGDDEGNPRGGGRQIFGAPGADGQAFGGSSAGMNPGGASGSGSGGQAAGAAAPGAIQIDPARIPTADALRKFLFPSTYAISVDEKGIRYEAREAFLDTSNVGIAGALLMPAVQAARDAARRAMERNATIAAAPRPAAAAASPLTASALRLGAEIEVAAEGGRVYAIRIPEGFAESTKQQLQDVPISTPANARHWSAPTEGEWPGPLIQVNIKPNPSARGADVDRLIETAMGAATGMLQSGPMKHKIVSKGPIEVDGKRGFVMRSSTNDPKYTIQMDMVSYVLLDDGFSVAVTVVDCTPGRNLDISELEGVARTIRRVK